jgi:hypothetical protein
MLAAIGAIPGVGRPWGSRSRRAKAAREGGQEALGAERPVDLVVQSAEPEDRQPGVGLADDAADGRNRLLRGAANLDVEGRAGIFTFEDGEEGLLGIVAEAAVVEASADADDYDIGLDFGTGALAALVSRGPETAVQELPIRRSGTRSCDHAYVY